MDDIEEKIRLVIQFKEKTDKVVLENVKYSVAMTVGICDVKVTAYVGDDMERHEYTMDWHEQTRQFVNVRRKLRGLFDDFKKMYNGMKIARMPPETMFTLLKKANNRRKTAERKVKFLRSVIRDAEAAIISRSRTIEEQWEVMKELQRRGHVTAEEIERVINDVSRNNIEKKNKRKDNYEND